MILRLQAITILSILLRNLFIFTTENDVGLKIKYKITFAKTNPLHHAHAPHAETCTLFGTDASVWRDFQKKVLRKISGVVGFAYNFCIHFNIELYELLNDDMQRINIYCYNIITSLTF